MFALVSVLFALSLSTPDASHAVVSPTLRADVSSCDASQGWRSVTQGSGCVRELSVGRKGHKGGKK